MRIPDKLPIIVFLYSKKDGKLFSYQKVKNKTKQEVIEAIAENKSEIHTYKLIEDCSMEDITKGFCMLPEKSMIEEIKEEIIDALHGIERSVDNLEFEIKKDDQ